jgi:protein-disulfide isomerase
MSKENNRASLNINGLISTAAIAVAAFFIGTVWQKGQMTNPTNVFPGVGDMGNNAGGDFAPSLENADVLETLKGYAESLGLNVEEFSTCVTSSEMAAAVKADLDSAVAAGVRGTPGNFLLDTQSGKIVSVSGAQPLDMLASSLAGLKDGSAEFVNVPLSLNGDKDYVRGETSARYALIEYSDYDCPFCGQFHATASQFVSQNPGEVKWIYRQFPLSSIHPNAQKKSEAALCAGKLGGNQAFWDMSDKMLGVK